MKDTQDSDISRRMRPRQVPGGPYLCWFLHTITDLGLLDVRRSETRFGVICVDGMSDFCKKFSHKKVLLVGSNPSSKSPDNSPFHEDTKSRQFVDKWFEGEGWTVAYENLVDYKTKNNKPLTVLQIKADLPWIVENMGEYNKMGYKIVACGKVAAKGLRLANVEYFEMPHPSGLCRFWNNKEAGEAKVKEMKEWVLKK